MKKGLFITIEGTEGSVKSTQAALLCAYLKKKGLRVVHTREPGGARLAEGIRRLLLDPANSMAPLTELFLYEAARAQHLADVVRPALKKGAVVVCDRYTDATEAYQAFGRRLPAALVKTLNGI